MSKTLLLVLGEGGHSQEMLRLVELLGPEYGYCYVLVDGDKVSAAKIVRTGPAYRVIRPRDKTHNLVFDTLKAVLCGLQALVILLRCRPDAIVTSGPSVAVPVCVVAKLMRRRVIFVETGSRIHALSITGRIIYNFADLFFVQWPQLLPRYPRAIYAGRIC